MSEIRKFLHRSTYYVRQRLPFSLSFSSHPNCMCTGMRVDLVLCVWYKFSLQGSTSQNIGNPLNGSSHSPYLMLNRGLPFPASHSRWSPNGFCYSRKEGCPASVVARSINLQVMPPPIRTCQARFKNRNHSAELNLYVVHAMLVPKREDSSSFFFFF